MSAHVPMHMSLHVLPLVQTMDHDVSVLLRKGSDERIEDLPKLRAEDVSNTPLNQYSPKPILP